MTRWNWGCICFPGRSHKTYLDLSNRAHPCSQRYVCSPFWQQIKFFSWKVTLSQSFQKKCQSVQGYPCRIHLKSRSWLAFTARGHFPDGVFWNGKISLVRYYLFRKLARGLQVVHILAHINIFFFDSRSYSIKILCFLFVISKSFEGRGNCYPRFLPLKKKLIYFLVMHLDLFFFSFLS